MLEFPILGPATLPRQLIIEDLFDLMRIRLPGNGLGEKSAVVATNLVSVIVGISVSEEVIRHRIVDVVHLVARDDVFLVTHSDHLVDVFLLSHVARLSPVDDELLTDLLLPAVAL